MGLPLIGRSGSQTLARAQIFLREARHTSTKFAPLIKLPRYPRVWQSCVRLHCSTWPISVRVAARAKT